MQIAGMHTQQINKQSNQQMNRWTNIPVLVSLGHL